MGLVYYMTPGLWLGLDPLMGLGYDMPCNEHLLMILLACRCACGFSEYKSFDDDAHRVLLSRSPAPRCCNGGESPEDYGAKSETGL